MNTVREHLRLLSLFHYIVGGLGCLVSLFPCFHLAMGLFMIAAPEEVFSTPPPPASSPAPAPDLTVARPPDVLPFRIMGAAFACMAAFMIVCGLACSVSIIIAGRRLAAYRSHTFCLVIAAIECMILPIGTVLGVLTILTLMKPEARQLFGLPALDGPPPPTS